MKQSRFPQPTPYEYVAGDYLLKEGVDLTEAEYYLEDIMDQAAEDDDWDDYNYAAYIYAILQENYQDKDHLNANYR